MRILLLACAGLLASAALWQPENTETTVIVTSTLEGYLTPCGCTKPMSGGIKRRAAAMKSLAHGKPTVILDSGGWIVGSDRQDEMKVEAMAESLRQTGTHAALWGSFESRLGASMTSTAARLSEGRLVSTSVVGDADLGLNRWIVVGPFLVGGLVPNPAQAAQNLSARPVEEAQALADLKEAASALELAPALIIEGGKQMAAALAKSEPALRFIVYRLQGSPPETLEFEGKTALITAGDMGRKIVALTYDGEAFKSIKVVDLGPEVADDVDVSRTHSRYLERVAQAGLLDRLPRGTSGGFVGSEACGSCHGDALEVWKGTRHSTALVTLEHEGHDKDPDCVSCHVTGLQDESGFRSREKTPLFASVGCESCHGPGAEHVKEPYKFKVPANGERSCMPCHTGNTSPGFDYGTYWSKVIHK